jgi:hypothetical protein
MTRLFTAAAVALFAAACDNSPVDLPVETELVLGTEAVSLFVGGATAVSAEVVDQNGVALRNAIVKWATSNAAVAAVDQLGTVVAEAEGTAEIIASYGSLTASIPVTVKREDRDFIQKVEFIESSGTYHWDIGPVELGVRLFDGRGVMKSCAFADEVSISASSSDESVAWVDAVPDIYGCRLEVDLNAPGTATITLRVNGAEASYDLTVTHDWSSARFLPDNQRTARAGDTLSVGVIVYDDNGNPVEGRTVNFSRGIGTLLDPVVKTGADGIARTRWVIPTDLRFLGIGAKWIAYDVDLGNGSTDYDSDYMTISTGLPHSLKYFYLQPDGRYRPVQDDTLTLEAGAPATRILVNAYDKFGNLINTLSPIHTFTDGGAGVMGAADNLTIGTQFIDFNLGSRSRYINVSSATAQTVNFEVEVDWAADEIKLTKKLTLKFVDPS